MNVQRIQWEIQQAIEHFPNIESHATPDGGLFIKALMQTSVGQVYVIHVTFVGYAAEMPKVTVITPVVTHNRHMYNSRHICYMHPNMWNPAKHDLKFVLANTAVWLNKHEVYKVTGIWPGPALQHTT